MSKRILLAGESWMSYTTHVKGADSFYTSLYETGETYLKAALERGGYEFTFMPNHVAQEEFPFTMDELVQYDLVILSDIGANTLLLPALTFTKSRILPNRCILIRDYVLEGGALLMIGGYLTFSGIDAKGNGRIHRSRMYSLCESCPQTTGWNTARASAPPRSAAILP